jgi:lipid-binding SYLF domain-containing protein
MLVSAVSIDRVVSAQQTEKESDRLLNAATVLKEIFGMPDAIPQDLLDKAECVIVFPSVKKVALGVGGSYGRGVISCRGGKTFDGHWGPPAMFALEGASIGFQSARRRPTSSCWCDDRSANSVMNNKIKLSADASAAVGPKGGRPAHRRHRRAG